MDIGLLFMKIDKVNEAFVLVGVRLFGVVIGVGGMKGLYKDGIGIGIVIYMP